MYAFILFRMSADNETRYGRVYHYSTLEDLDKYVHVLQSGGKIVIYVLENIDNILVA